MAEQHHLAIFTHGRGSFEITDQIAALVRSAAVKTPEFPIFSYATPVVDWVLPKMPTPAYAGILKP